MQLVDDAAHERFVRQHLRRHTEEDRRGDATPTLFQLRRQFVMGGDDGKCVEDLVADLIEFRRDLLPPAIAKKAMAGLDADLSIKAIAGQFERFFKNAAAKRASNAQEE